jgi:lon-related putative ATP-dependent protease
VCAAKKLGPEELHKPCAPADVPFETTASATGTEGVVGQSRAVEALRFGIGLKRAGTHLFAIGPTGVGKRTVLHQVLEPETARAPTPSDWVYVHHFSTPERPKALELPPGLGSRFTRDMAAVVAELRVSLRAAFTSEEYRTRLRSLVERIKSREDKALAEVQERARAKDVAVVKTDTGVAIAPIIDGQPSEPDRFNALPKEQRERLEAELERVGLELKDMLRRFHEWAHEHLDAVKALDAETAKSVARRVLNGVRKTYVALENVQAHLDEVEADVIESADQFLQGDDESFETTLKNALRHDGAGPGPSFRRYLANLVVDNGGRHGAPLVTEDNPTMPALLGRVEHETQFGALITNFTLIKPGALHHALGGTLILDALKVLQNPFAWDALKRCLKSGQITIESLGQLTGLVSTVSVEPEPIPLGRTKVILVGERRLYYLLAALDPDVPELFKVLVDFEEDLNRTPESELLYANLVASLVKKEGLLPFDRTGVARVIDAAAREASDQARLSMHVRRLVDLLHGADYWAQEAGATVVRAEHVQAALDAEKDRAGRVPERLQEALARKDLLIATDGAVVGQVNGLSVMELGEHLFGHPTRITARVRLGHGDVLDIEREVKLGGPIHSKGVLILGGFLGARYATGVPLSLSASLVFEQSYGGVEGDSASLAELCALLSALAEAPVKQALALTGSVNQLGQVQSIGGVNEKVEGFFDLCQARGLRGEHGVLIPKSNAKNLMLKREVVEAVKKGSFHLWCVEDVDEALELLTGLVPGARGPDGAFPQGTLNAKVEARLLALAEGAKKFGARGDGARPSGAKE